MEIKNFTDTWPIIKLCFNLLDHREKIKVILIAYLLLFSSCLEMIAIMGVMPFVALVIEPNTLIENDVFKNFKFLTNNYTVHDLIIFFSIFSLFLLMLSLVASFLIQHYSGF